MCTMDFKGQNIEKRSDEDGGALFCGPCKREHKEVITSEVCKECEEFMCRICFGHHLKAKSCVEHTLVDVFQFPIQGRRKNPEICTKHGDEKVKFFCRNHGDVGCGECMVLEHNSCKPEYIKDLSKLFGSSDVFKDTKMKVDGFENECKTAFELVDSQREQNNLLLEKALEQLQTFRKDVNEWLDKAEEKNMNEASKLKSLNDSKIENQYELIKSVHTDVEKLQQKLNKDEHSDSALFINYHSCKPYFCDIEKSLMGAKGNRITSFKFKANEDISRLVCAEQQLGSLDTEPSSLVQEGSSAPLSSGQVMGKKQEFEITPIS